MTGSALAIPLLGATSAGAAEAGTWDRVAECESGGMWSADLGNGYYGGLQFSQEKWDRYGGAAYAPRPDLASRAQQIKVADKMLAAEGPKAWPSCAVISGLAPGGADGSGSASGGGAASGGVDAADPDTGSSTPATPPAGSVRPDTPGSVTDRDLPAAGQEPSTPAGSAEPSASGATAGPVQPSPDSSVEPSTGPGTVPGADTGTAPGDDTSALPDAGQSSPGAQTPGSAGSEGGGKHRGTPAPENSLPGADVSVEPGAGRSADPSAGSALPPATDERDSSRHASRGGGKSPAVPAADDTYTVRPGDNLSHIADAAKLPGGWPALYEANKTALGDDPDLIRPGQHLELGDE
ncbi:transglycosylase family protein [Streptomyces sp. NPDC058657]|uniref:transglycosylase family protein n=1 Tax=unclassified Streptomyces TaxID=2593676 RepID=UPI00366316A9